MLLPGRGGNHHKRLPLADTLWTLLFRKPQDLRESRLGLGDSPSVVSLRDFQRYLLRETSWSNIDQIGRGGKGKASVLTYPTPTHARVRSDSRAASTARATASPS